MRGITTPQDRDRETIRYFKVINKIVSKGKFTPLHELNYTWFEYPNYSKKTDRK